ncbi:ABC transporter ATP-binding protein [Saccharolobus solfataricus]|uniref:ABC transporter, ATP binding protein related protein n=3 Tax=Saccharolobus solfataricus TaxID=2287 RepID=Q97U54_SACS2|nr:ABC transporter ATP-binding protein [Saccharolobus solfataricus]AAK43268.1 ABC transporter, ATP binding protein related protein [Saccharolobus solfataricus P2]AKA73292.1 ABC transporter ATP-binding protein [Saccharolobus solfataricus]AKA75991.1 ABC transporter ATP-binding protein [Saccharolobus solfataricus]AKA78684.1 ABC transporter ATP-binding protein [Saccharolobus solfataricus]AZF67759.1 ABC transporter ATP-binding protein [Saccharolobus solfataricus]
MLETINLTKIYRDGTVALDNLTFSANTRVVTLLGRNGAGKTTLTRILSTQLLPTSGIARVEGYDVVKDARKVRKIIASIPQEAKSIGIASPMEHLIMYLTARGLSFKEATEISRSALKEVGLWEVRDKPSDELSGGMKRKIFVAMALASNAELVLLDEPTTGLDPYSRLEVWSVLKSIKSKILLTTHYMEEAEELSDEVILLHKGKLIAKGSIKELLTKFDNKVRIEGIGEYKIGRLRISYVDRNEASDYVGKYVIKPITLEDLFIIYGGESLEE